LLVALAAMPALTADTFAAVLSAPLGAVALAQPTPPRTSAPIDSFSIEECADLARTHAPDVRALSMDLESARADSAAAVRAGRPVVKFAARATVAPDGFYDPAVTNLGEYEAKIGVTIPLRSRATARRARAMASGNVRAAGFERGRAAREAGDRAIELAVAILRLRDQASSRESALAWLDDLAALLASRVRAGSAGPADTVRLGLERDAVGSELQGLQAEARSTGRELAQLIGMSAAELPLIRAPGEGVEHEPAAQDSLRLLDGLHRLPEVAAAREAVTRAHLDTEETLSRRAWQLEAGADAGLAGTNLNELVPRELRAENPGATFRDRLRRDAGASLSLQAEKNLLDPTLAPAVESRRAAAQAAALRAATEESTQERGALDLLDNWHAAWQRLQEARRSVARAEDNLLRRKSLYAAGATGMLDLLDARRVLGDARERLAEAHADTRLLGIKAEVRP
jgi:outer membrane protein TolC